MSRPNRVWCGITLGLAILVGCAKKPTADTSESASAAPAAGPSTPKAQPTPAPVAPGKTESTGDSGGGLGSILSAATSAVASTPAPVAAPTTVELNQCRFATVEAALTAAKGKVVLVDCWARWCPPCLTSFPKLVEKHEKYKDKGLVCVSVSLDAGQKRFNPDQVHSFLKEKNALFQNFYLTDLGADNAALEKRFGQIDGIPHAALLNKAGERVWTGHPMDGKLVAKIEAELAK